MLLDVDVEHKWAAGQPVCGVVLAQRQEVVRYVTRHRLVRVRRPTNLIITEDVELAYEGVPPPMPLIIGFT